MLSDAAITAPADAVVIPIDSGFMALAAETATVLRQAGVRTQVYFEDRKFKQKLSYADKAGIPFALIIGENEAALRVAAVKDLAAGTQETLSPEDAAAKISAALAGRRSCAVIQE